MASLYHIYVALEEEIERNKQNPVYAPLYFPEELHRRTALEQDMAFWYGPHWQKTIPYTPATQHYVKHLHEVGRTHPELLVAHTYTRYLGDLSGGQVLKKIAQKALDLPSSGEGLAFFTFPNIDSPTKFKQLYRARMNTLEMTPEVKHRVTEEAKTAFLLNIEVSFTTPPSHTTVIGGRVPESQLNTRFSEAEVLQVAFAFGDFLYSHRGISQLSENASIQGGGKCGSCNDFILFF